MKNFLTSSISCLLFMSQACSGNTTSKSLIQNHELAATTQIITSKTALDTKNIQVALLLDTSNSMDGLIDQAKAQLWKIVNELSYAKCGNVSIKLQIALYEYGNDGLNAREGYVRQVLPFSEDLDEISQQLFALHTNGGNEFCGKVIATSINQLSWKKESSHLKLIFIAGNEPFTQGPVNYNDAATDATEKGITINTIFCGDYKQGIATRWKDGADLTHGEYSAIDHNIATRHINTPYDDEILSWNKKLNSTYVRYGAKGEQKMKMQEAQDDNAYGYSSGNAVSRAISKSSGFYKNKSWDLVDAIEEEAVDLEKIETNELPKELQQKSPEDLKKHIQEKAKERSAIQKEIQLLNSKRSTYIDQNTKDEDHNLEKALLNAIKKQGQRKSFEWTNEN